MPSRERYELNIRCCNRHLSCGVGEEILFFWEELAVENKGITWHVQRGMRRDFGISFLVLCTVDLFIVAVVNQVSVRSCGCVALVVLLRSQYLHLISICV